jgi:hypothetical protein
VFKVTYVLFLKRIPASTNVTMHSEEDKIIMVISDARKEWPDIFINVSDGTIIIFDQQQ